MKEFFKIATPVSHLFNDKKLRTKIINSSDILELRDNEINIESLNSFIYHSELNFLAKWSYREIKKLEEMSENHQIDLVSYHLASRYQKNIISNNAYVGVGDPISISEMKSNIRENLRITMDIFGYEIPILVENNNHYLTDAYDMVTSTEFIKEIVEENDIYLLLDLSHAKITSINKKIDFEQYLTKLPLNRCKQIHLSGHSVINGLAVDSHSELQKENWVEFEDLLELLDSVEFVTIEYYKNGDNLLNQLKKLKEIQEDFKLNNSIHILEWDSQFFGFKAAKLENLDINSKMLEKIIENAKKEKIKCIYCLSEPENKELLSSFGFNQIDEKVEFAQEIRAEYNYKEVKIEMARGEDTDEIKEISSSAFRGMSRFYKDHHFNPEKVNEMYEVWIDNLMSDPDSDILIVRENDKIVAFNGISLKNGEGRIELIAVDKNSKNKGYGELLIKQSQKYFDRKNLEKKNIKIEGHRIYLRPLTVFDVSEKYCSWLNDPEVTKYLESKKATLEELKEYVKVRYYNPHCLFLGIFLKDGDVHIGNVKLEPIDFKERKAKLGLLIGEKDYWNKGYEAEIYSTLENYAFKSLKLIEIDTGLYKEDIEEIKHLEKSGFNIYDEDDNIYKMRMKVVTQEKNIPATSLYTKMGFVDHERKYWFHWWNEELKDG